MTRRSVLLTLAVLVALPLLLATAEPPVPPVPPASPAPQVAPTVRVTIDYHDGVQKTFLAIAHRADMTVLDATVEAGRHPRGIKLDFTGKGETAFVQKIDDLANQGGGKTRLNWQFSVNGKAGTRGCGATPLQPGDVVLWEFDTMKLPG